MRLFLQIDSVVPPGEHDLIELVVFVLHPQELAPHSYLLPVLHPTHVQTPKMLHEVFVTHPEMRPVILLLDQRIHCLLDLRRP